jgi:pyruvate dehydrogenase E1 component
MFGFQRVGDLLWAAGDARCRGFVLGAAAGRTTLAGEGPQHQDGNSHLYALAFPDCRAYDPCYAYETAVIVLDGLRRMLCDQQDVFYYITLTNENYKMPLLPLGSTEGICRGIYKLSSRDAGPKRPTVRLLASGAILREALRAQDLLDERFRVGSDLFSVTSYKALYDDGRQCDHWNRLHPQEPPRQPYVRQVLAGSTGPIVAALDYVAAVGLSLAPWVNDRTSPLTMGEGPGPGVSSYVVLGADGFGRSEARRELRRFFAVDAESIALAALVELVREGKYPREKLPAAIKTLGLDPNKRGQNYFSLARGKEFG